MGTRRDMHVDAKNNPELFWQLGIIHNGFHIAILCG